MKTLTTLKSATAVSLLLLMSVTLNAQKKFKFGDVPKEDLSMTVYPTDTAANAAVLHEEKSIDFVISDYTLVAEMKYTIRIKILKPGGLDLATQTISYQYGKNYKEDIISISGFTHNLNPTNGKIEKTKLDKQYIAENQVVGDLYVKKIAFQNAKVGSVIELKYEMRLPSFGSFRDVVFQRDIPVRYSCFTTVIPEYYIFTKNTLGYETVQYKESKESLNLHFPFGIQPCDGKGMTFEVFELPALKGDNYTWYYHDFLTRVKFELTGIRWPNGKYEDFSSTWNKVDKQLMEEESFGKQFRLTGLLKPELTKILSSDTTDLGKVEQIVSLVKNKIKWNGRVPLFVDDVKKAIKEGKGSSADMNALLISLLHEAGYNAYPVVMSVKSRGRIQAINPTIKNLSYFIVRVDIDNNIYYVDASTTYGGLNALSIDCLVDNARVIKTVPEVSEWVDLQNIQKNRVINNIIVGFNEQGILSGQYQSLRTGVEHQLLCNELEMENGIEKYKERISKDTDLEIKEFTASGNKNGSTSTKINFEFAKGGTALDADIIYLNPLIVSYMNESPFKAETRKLPVEFRYPKEYRQSVLFVIPKGYKVETLPQSDKVVFNDNGLIFAYSVKLSGEELHINQIVSLNRTVFSPQEYESLRDAYLKIVNKNTEQLVLKKIKE